ncbi:potassium-transporting ATPase subunit KdpC [Gottfriedia acidiceleris]|uniref:potassium-transporting ATPase subunit KdpC n=1 Tax=Gottfriedia acidiceleris TaxID=371036 RepID=UPI000B447240|nr:potassium-transporting ATPase subunit KdpC [Gottfriedia acidiceleris]
MSEGKVQFGPIIRMTLVLILICGIIYPLTVTGVAQVIMKDKADGSLIYNKKKQVIGSELIGQQFTSPEYFHGRVSSIEYKSEGSGSNNFAPSNPDLKKRLDESVAAFQKENPGISLAEIPMDLITNSGSGLDPHISPKAADVQIDRIAKSTGLDKKQLKDLVKKHTEGRALGQFGEERVNVLKLNIEITKLLNK